MERVSDVAVLYMVQVRRCCARPPHCSTQRTYDSIRTIELELKLGRGNGQQRRQQEADEEPHYPWY